METPPILPEWAMLHAALSNHPAQHAAYRHLYAIPIGTRFKLRHLLAVPRRPHAKTSTILATKIVLRRALMLGLIRKADGIYGLVPYYERVK